MNWDALGAIAEGLGALAVLGTLGYLAVQLRQNTRLTNTSLYESAMDGYFELNRTMTDAELSAFFFKCRSDPDRLSEYEVFRYHNLTRMYLAHVYKLFRLYQQGVLPAREWETTARDARRNMANAAQLYARFKADNPFFDDLYPEIEPHASS